MSAAGRRLGARRGGRAGRASTPRGRAQGVDHRAVAGPRAADLLHPREAGPEGVAHGLAAGGGVAGRGEEDRQQHARGAAHGLAELLADRAVELGQIGERQAVDASEDGARGGGQRGAGVAVAGPGVERVQVRLGRDQDLAAARRGKRGSRVFARASAQIGVRPSGSCDAPPPRRPGAPGQAASGDRHAQGRLASAVSG